MKRKKKNDAPAPSRLRKESIYDLAGKVGVSASTVSRVLNERPGIGEETRKIVLELARSRGFRPRTRVRQTTIALVVDRLQYTATGGFVPSMLGCLMHELSRKRFAVELVTEQNLERLHERFIDGVIGMVWDEGTLGALKTLVDIPVVLINRLDVAGFSAVATDHRRDGETAAAYLASRGHRHLCFIGEEENNWGTRERVAGFLQKSRGLDLAVGPANVGYTEHQAAFRLLKRFINDLGPTALFVANENLALEVNYVLREMLGLRIPQDISILGMESLSVSQFLSPPMTSLVQPLDALAREALEMVCRKMAETSPKPETLKITNTLIERESVSILAR